MTSSSTMSTSAIARTAPNLDLSVVAPIYNEVESVPKLIDAIADSVSQSGLSYEIICVDDGSKDGSAELLRDLATTRQDLCVVLLRRNYGQTPAMAAGFNQARGKVIVTLDGDLQNDPRDIPKLLAKLNEGYDLVSGWRKDRKDATLTRTLPSKIANWLIGRTTGVRLHDYGCSLKAYRAELVADMNLYGELHRFLQTVYAQQPGAVAAPTAGLHFTKELLQRLQAKGIEQTYVTLHVGVGTFRPVEVEDITSHSMHQEWIEVSPKTVEQIERAKARGGRIIAVGTTVVRTLEGTAKETKAQGKLLEPFCGKTDLFIYPGYKWRVVDGLITNFHLPGSSLLMLVSALVGRKRLLSLYREAIEERYRFYSFGDAMLILPAARI